MSKISIKAKRKGVSVHSRAARRAVSPPLPGKETVVESKPTYTPSIGTATFAQPQGIRKKKKQQQTRSQKRRLEKTLDRALAVAEKTQIKVSKSESRLKNVRDRRKDWDDVNGERKKRDAPGSRFSLLMSGDDEDMGDDKPAELPLRNPPQAGNPIEIRKTNMAAEEEEDIL